jgi:hypothetical protein
MANTVFSITAGGNDSQIEEGKATWPPTSTDTFAEDSTSDVIDVQKSKWTNYYFTL